MTSSPGFLNTGNLSPMSPTPVGEFSGILPFDMNTISQDTASLNREFPSGTGANLLNGKGLMVADNATSGFHYDAFLNPSVNWLSQPGLHSNRLQTKQESVVIPMETDKQMMPVNAGLHCGERYSNLDFMGMVKTKNNQINGSSSNQVHYGYTMNGQMGNLMGTSMQRKKSSGTCKSGSPSSRMQWTKNNTHFHVSQYSKLPMSTIHPLNQPHQQHFTHCDRYSEDGSCNGSNGNHYNSISSNGSADARSFCMNSVGWHSPNGLHYQQHKLPPQKQVEQDQFHDPPDSQQIQFSMRSQVLPTGPFSQSQLLQQEQYHRQQQNFEKQHHHLQHHQQKQQNVGPQKHHHQQYQQPQQNFEKQQHHLQHYQQNQQKFGPQQHQHQQYQQQQQKFQQEHNWYSYQGPQPKHIHQGKSLPNSNGSQQLDMSYNQKPKQLWALSPQLQLKTQSQNNPFAPPNKVQPKADLQGQQESKPLVKLPSEHELPCLGKQKQLEKHIQGLLTTDEPEAHQFLWPQEASIDEPSASIKTENRDRTANEDAGSSRQPTDITKEGQHESGPDVSFAFQARNSVDEEQSQEPPLKKAKITLVSPCNTLKKVETQQESVPIPNTIQVASQFQDQAGEQNEQNTTMKHDAPESFKLEIIPAKADVLVNLQQSIAKRHDNSKKDVEAKYGQVQWECSPQVINAEPTVVTLSKVPVLLKKEKKHVNHESQRITAHSDSSTTVKSRKLKLKAISLIEIFTPEQIRDHIAGLQQLSGQSKENVENNKDGKHEVKENACQLCMAGNLKFEPPPIYCTSCGARIKHNATYYSAGVGLTRICFCLQCYNGIQHDTIGLDGVTYLKEKLDKRKNDEETEEEWIKCCKCKAWQHQICALFNARRNETGHADYTCPNCCIVEIERGERRPLHQTAILGAKDLPRTSLSDHIEQRLSRRLKQERAERARSLGKGYEEVPGAEALVVRVVSSVDKKVEVKPHFLEIVGGEDYPVEFPYRSKVLLLFQKIEGVEVCLLSMYVQEFGSECSHPNQRRICLSYLDSVKYFRPDVKTVTGESLRTLVYHEILIGYLDFCKRRGFTSFYIWACPPLKGEDYIHYCHPEIQKTPNCDKLREWYHTMLSKATKEDIVLEVTNFYDYFFTSSDECKAVVTATCLPYFDGDYWPGAIEDMILQLKLEYEDCRKQHKKLKAKRNTTNCISKASLQSGLTSNLSKETLLMQKLGESTYAMKDDFIMAHMHHTCAHCHQFILSGKRWLCDHYQCRNYQICGKCYDADKKLDEEDRHPINN